MRIYLTAIALLAGMFAPLAADPTVYGARSEAVFFDTSFATQDQQDILEKYSDHTYFGAVFLEKGGTAWGAYSGANRFDDAAKLALMICEAHAQTGDCVPALFIAPTELKTGAPPKKSLGFRASQEYRTFESRQVGHRAFAISHNHAYGWATGKQTPAEAVDAALTQCNRNSMKSLLQINHRIREEALEAGYYDCEIVAHNAPGADPS